MDDARNKAIKLQLRRAERQLFLVGMPMPPHVLMQFFEEVDDAVEEWGCDHSFRHFEAACRDESVEPAPMIAWFRDRSHSRDCEAVSNVTGWPEDAIKETPGPSA